MQFSDFLKIIQLLPLGFFNDFAIKVNGKDASNYEISFKDNYINFTE